MSGEGRITLELLARQQKQLLEELRMLRDDALVTQRILLRIDARVRELEKDR